jgi:hypothetical protein
MYACRSIFDPPMDEGDLSLGVKNPQNKKNCTAVTI